METFYYFVMVSWMHNTAIDINNIGREYNRPLLNRRLNFRFGYTIPHVQGSSCIVKSTDSGFRYLSSYLQTKVFLV